MTEPSAAWAGRSQADVGPAAGAPLCGRIPWGKNWRMEGALRETLYHEGAHALTDK
ncbi:MULTISPECIES: hypothetical protein [unclassified Streptomyces]|uniref:hypothetical protein n=1 Tax=Streptomyces TaxID=1883 RepID=UPI001368B2AA|nr:MULTISPECIES: hypothetical protein [unclassified Streptomyces]NEA05090.1 hypothetical protein [Streptomyces sp. SID10116]MYY87107.1 hypothetical protein [Streptomyces sp. SID335]MYZ12405.1 hypothetical protein [Streptomyces sp. SID337]NDZ89472.1 hypothetical protein [Streptomyces sp. SID10115]NEB47776.1 hypothetical protein [Streptomyces sp. SID339]